jgi:hypothetical protein
VTLTSSRSSSLVRALVASLIAWPVTGLLMSLVFSQTPQSESELLGAWTPLFQWVWLNLLALPLYGSVFFGHFVFIVGLFQLAERTKHQQPERKATLLVVATLSGGVLLKVASYVVFLPDTWGIALLLVDSLVAIFVIFLTAPRARKSSLLLEK